MRNNNTLKYLKHAEIDSERWNHCIDNAPNCRVYGYYWHLNRTAEIWDALIWGNYEFVMPLPFRKKLGIKYIYQPLFSQQLGIFPNPPEEIKEQFYNLLLQSFRYSNFQINAANSPSSKESEINFIPRKNYLLKLNTNYTQLSKKFAKNTKRNIAKANKNELTLVQGVGMEEYLEFNKNNMVAAIKPSELARLKSVIAFGQHKGFGEIYGAYTTENQLCAAVYFCRWKERVIYLNAASSSLGKKLRGMYFLVDNFIKNNAGQNITLDFEGSNIQGVERFYNGFGATAETYFLLKINRLPLPFKWLKQK